MERSWYGDGNTGAMGSSRGFGGLGSYGGGFGGGYSQGSSSFVPPMPTQPYIPPANSQPSSATLKQPSFKLRRSIRPKPALHLLNELLGGKKPSYEYYEVPYEEKERRAQRRNLPVDEVGDFDCLCTIENEQYFGDGLNKNDSKNAAAETAIQGEVIRRCSLNESERRAPNEDNCPWVLLASLALHKMYDSWQSQGYSIPKELLNVPNDECLSVRPPTKSGNTNWMKKDEKSGKPPLQTLNEMISRCGFDTEFTLADESGTPNDKNFVFRLSINNNQHVYDGKGKSKKLAKNAAASAAVQDSDAWYVPRSNRAQTEEEGLNLEGYEEEKDETGNGQIEQMDQVEQ